jgi:cell filamentation protein
LKPSPSDPYCYPGTETLRNLNDLRDAADLEAFEGAMVAIRLGRLGEEPIEGPFDLNRLLETHRRIFGGVYEWAGQLRRDTGTMIKQRESGYAVAYGDSANVPTALADIFAKLEREAYLTGLALGLFAFRAAYYYGEIDAIHPFREGNSRTLRQFFVDLARAAGYKLDWTSASRTEEQRGQIFMARDFAVLRGDSSRLARIIEENLRPL